MYYEERVLNGALWCRSTPNGSWTKVPYESVLGRMLLAEKQLAKAIAKLQEENQR